MIRRWRYHTLKVESGVCHGVMWVFVCVWSYVQGVRWIEQTGKGKWNRRNTDSNVIGVEGLCEG